MHLIWIVFFFFVFTAFHIIAINVCRSIYRSDSIVATAYCFHHATELSHCTGAAVVTLGLYKTATAFQQFVRTFCTLTVLIAELCKMAGQCHVDVDETDRFN
jgi:hypothetical protein